MDSRAYYKRYVEKLIAANPASVVIERAITVQTERGGTKAEIVTLEPQTVSIYNRRALRERVDDAGRTVSQHVGRATKVLATVSTDLEKGDEFKHDGRTWRVGYVAEYLGICRQAELEAIE